MRTTVEVQKAMLTQQIGDEEQELWKEYGRLGEGIMNRFVELCPPGEVPSGKEFVETFGKIDVTDLEVILGEAIASMGKIRQWKRELEELKNARVCPRCGIIVQEDELFCFACGERLLKDAVSADDDVCPQCGKPRKEDDAAFCVFCGYRFGQMEEPESDVKSGVDDGGIATENAQEEDPLPPEPRVRRCVNCGEVLEDDVLFCHICGFRQPEQG